MDTNFSKIRMTGKLLSSKEISCEELTKQYLNNIEKENKILNAYVTITAEEALESAKKVDEKIRRGDSLLPLEGIPMSLKDNISTKNIKTTCCSKILQNYFPIYNATVWNLLKQQNSVLLGKTNMDEFAMGSSSETSCFGGSLNPHNSNHVAGGSSGGAAASVSGNIAVFGLGSDTGGSIRQPASFCGVVGLKPTYGTVSRYGLIAYASSFDQIGPITTSVEDAALVFDAIAEYDPMDSTSQGKKQSAAAGLTQNIKGMKIGLVKEYFEDIDEDVREAMEKAIETYRQLGAEIVECSISELKYGLPVYYILACAEASSNLGRYDGIRYGFKVPHYEDLNEMICKTRSEGFGAEVKHRILLGTYVLSAGYYDAYYKKAQNLRGVIVNAFKRVFESCDIILAPTVPMTSFPCGQTVKDAIQTYQTDICTVPVNIAGLPAISIPCGWDRKGLPIGLQLIGNNFCEATILNAAYQYEAVTRTDTYKAVDMGVTL